MFFVQSMDWVRFGSANVCAPSARGKGLSSSAADQITTVSERRHTVELDVYDSEEWRSVVAGIGCDVGQFASVRHKKLAQFYGRIGLYRRSKSKRFFDESAKDDVLVFASGCFEYPSANEQQLIDVQIVLRHPNENYCIFEKRTEQTLSSNFWSKSVNGTDNAIAFFVATKFSGRKCFFLKSEDSFVGYLTFKRRNSAVILQQIELPETNFDKVPNHFVEFVALEQIRLNEKKLRKVIKFHKYRGLPIILAWNKQFFFPHQWEFWPSALSYDEDPNSNCPYQCIYTTERTTEASASVLLFHVFWSNPIGFWPFWSWPQHRSEEQLYAFFTQESPYYAGSAFNKLSNDWFNLSMTYHADSTIATKYDELLEHRSGEMLAGEDEFELWHVDEIETRVRQKSKLVLQIVSKCGASSARDILTAQLGQLVPVDVFASHFFYLAFENSVCPQYVTEKFWNAFRALTVPVVLRRAVLRGMGVPDDAYIAADDFCSAQELAQHLLALRHDIDRYMQFFNWTRKYSKKKRKSLLSPICQLCKIAQKYPRPKYAIDKRNFWTEAQCKYNFVEKDLFNCSQNKKINNFELAKVTQILNPS